jgi:hypothetical protein
MSVEIVTDRNGSKLLPGDLVNIPCRISSIHGGEGGRHWLAVEIVHEGPGCPAYLSINSQQVVKGKEKE